MSKNQDVYYSRKATSTGRLETPPLSPTSSLCPRLSKNMTRPSSPTVPTLLLEVGPPLLPCAPPKCSSQVLLQITSSCTQRTCSASTATTFSPVSQQTQPPPPPRSAPRCGASKTDSDLCRNRNKTGGVAPYGGGDQIAHHEGFVQRLHQVPPRVRRPEPCHAVDRPHNATHEHLRPSADQPACPHEEEGKKEGGSAGSVSPITSNVRDARVDGVSPGVYKAMAPVLACEAQQSRATQRS